jgi:Flp pilus assembly protein TadD
MTGAARPQTGEALYAERTGRFVRLIEEQTDQALLEYGFSVLNSIDESDGAFFLRSINLADESWRQRFLEAVAIHRRGRYDEAEKRYKALLSESKEHKEIEYNLAALFCQRGDLDSARKHLEAFEKWIAGIDVSEASPSFLEECRARIVELRSELEPA